MGYFRAIFALKLRMQFECATNAKKWVPQSRDASLYPWPVRGLTFSKFLHRLVVGHHYLMIMHMLMMKMMILSRINSRQRHGNSLCFTGSSSSA